MTLRDMLTYWAAGEERGPRNFILEAAERENARRFVVEVFVPWIMREIMGGMVDSWIFQLDHDYRTGAVIPSITALCDGMTGESNLTVSRARKIRGDLRGLWKDANEAGNDLILNTYRDLVLKLKRQSKQYERELTPLRRDAAAIVLGNISMEVTLQRNERVVLKALLAKIREDEFPGDFDLEDFHNELKASLANFKFESSHRIKSMLRVYAETGNREAIRMYYFSLVDGLRPVPTLFRGAIPLPPS